MWVFLPGRERTIVNLTNTGTFSKGNIGEKKKKKKKKEKKKERERGRERDRENTSELGGVERMWAFLCAQIPSRIELTLF